MILSPKNVFLGASTGQLYPFEHHYAHDSVTIAPQIDAMINLAARFFQTLTNVRPFIATNIVRDVTLRTAPISYGSRVRLLFSDEPLPLALALAQFDDSRAEFPGDQVSFQHDTIRALGDAEWLVADIKGLSDILIVNEILATVHVPTYLMIHPGARLDSQQLITLMKQVMVCQIEQQVLQQVTGQSDVSLAIEQLASEGISRVIIVMPEIGTRALCEGERIQVPIFGDNIVYDSFAAYVIAGTMLAAMRKGEPFDFALAYASAAAAWHSAGGQIGGWSDLVLITSQISKRSGR